MTTEDEDDDTSYDTVEGRIGGYYVIPDAVAVALSEDAVDDFWINGEFMKPDGSEVMSIETNPPVVFFDSGIPGTVLVCKSYNLYADDFRLADGRVVMGLHPIQGTGLLTVGIDGESYEFEPIVRVVFGVIQAWADTSDHFRRIEEIKARGGSTEEILEVWAEVDPSAAERLLREREAEFEEGDEG